MFAVSRSMTRRAGRRRQRGQALVEFALVAPIFFLLVFSVIQLGIMFGGQNGLVAATRELARYAAPFRVKTPVDAANVCADTRLTKQLSGFLQRSIPGYVASDVGVRTVQYSWLLNADNTTYSVEMTVHVSYHFPLYVPLVGGLIDGFDGASDNRFLLDAKETMRIENEALTAGGTSPACNI
jgi:Flp pilus assembly protein TadG